MCWTSSSSSNLSNNFWISNSCSFSEFNGRGRILSSCAELTGRPFSSNALPMSQSCCSRYKHRLCFHQFQILETTVNQLKFKLFHACIGRLFKFNDSICQKRNSNEPGRYYWTTSLVEVWFDVGYRPSSIVCSTFHKHKHTMGSLCPHSSPPQSQHRLCLQPFW